MATIGQRRAVTYTTRRSSIARASVQGAGAVETAPRAARAACGGQAGSGGVMQCQGAAGPVPCVRGRVGVRRAHGGRGRRAGVVYERGSERVCGGGDEWGAGVGSGGVHGGAASKGREGNCIAGEVIRPGPDAGSGSVRRGDHSPECTVDDQGRVGRTERRDAPGPFPAAARGEVQPGEGD